MARLNRSTRRQIRAQQQARALLFSRILTVICYSTIGLFGLVSVALLTHALTLLL